MYLLPLTQVFIFRSGSVGNNWIHIYNLVEEVVKKIGKYGSSCCRVFSLLGRAHIDSVGIPQGRGMEPRAEL